MPAKLKDKRLGKLLLSVAIVVMAAVVTFGILLASYLAALPGAVTKNGNPLPQPLPRDLPQSAFTAVDFTYDGGFLTCAGGNYLVGIDVSHHQQEIDWQKVADAGVDFVMVRLGYRGLKGDALYEDRFVRQNLTGAREAGLLVGAYFYSQAITIEEAEEEARYALEILGDYPLDLPLVYDWEEEDRTRDMSTRMVTACSAAFCRVVEAAGYQPMIYFNSYQAENLMELAYLTEYPWWLAMYDTAAEFPCRFDMWQYTDGGSVPGIEGNVDLDILLTEQ